MAVKARVRVIVKNVRKRLGRFELAIERLTMESGVYLVVGPNGSGKTTFLKLLTGLIMPDRGSITFEVDGARIPARSILRKAAIVMTDLELPNMTVKDLVRAYTGLGESEIMEVYGLASVADKKYGELSSGYKKRVQMAIALSKDADIIIMDEPFINVDGMFIRFLEDKVLELKRSNKLVVVATHAPTRLLSEHIILLDGGRILFSGRIPDLPLLLVEIEAQGGSFEKSSISLKELISVCKLAGRDVSVRVRPLHEAVYCIARGICKDSSLLNDA